MENTYTAVFYQNDDGSYVGAVEEILDVSVQAPTLESARRELRESVQLMLRANRAILRDRLPAVELIEETITVEVHP